MEYDQEKKKRVRETWRRKLTEKVAPLIESDDDLGNISGRESVKAFIIETRSGKCESCGVCDWLGKPLSLQVHHVDGNARNNRPSNLKILCPNCHSQTDNFAAKNIKRKVSDAELVAALDNPENKTVAEALRAVGMADKGRNYYRVKMLKSKE